MTDEVKELIQLQLEMLKRTMKENGVVFALAVDKKDKDDSELLFLDKQQYFTNNKLVRFSVSLTELNRDLL